MKRLCVLALSLFLVCLAFAQQPPKPDSKAAAPDPPPTLTETEALRLENLPLKAAVLQQQFNETQPMRDLNQQFLALTTKLNQEHAGWVFNVQTREFVKAPAPPKPPAPEARK